MAKLKHKKRNVQREILIGISLLAVTCVIIFLALEVTARMIDFEYMPMQYDSCLGLKFVPNNTGTLQRPEFTAHPRFNAEGFHDVDHQVKKEDGVYRILVLGDSFMEASHMDLEKGFARQLESKLNASTHQKVEVINLGVGGSGTDQELRALECYGLKYKPDMVILGFLTSNDVRNNYQPLNQYACKPYYYIDVNNKIVLNDSFTASCSKEDKSIKKWVAHRSRFLYFAYLSYQKIVQKKNLEAGLPLDFGIYSTNYSQDFNKAWQVTERLILRVRQVSEDNGAEFVLVTLSNPQQLSWQETQQKYPELKAGYDPLKPDLLMKGFCTKNRIDCIHLIWPFLDYKNQTGKELHYEIDGHWDAEGYSLAAQVVSDSLSKRVK
jgi:hypothetical protein